MYFEQTYFHFHATFVCMAWFILAVSCFKEPNMQQSCFEVAKYAEKWLVHEDPITMAVADPQFLNNFALCVRHVHKLVKQSDWAAIQKIIPPRAHSFLKTVSSQTLKDGLSLAGKGGLQVVSFYVFYQSVELYKRAVSLEIDYQRYHNEFEFLRTKKILPIMEQIERDILQQLEIRDTASSINLYKKLIKELGDYNTELRAMLKLIYKDYKEARAGAVGSVGYSIAAGCVCAGSLVVGWPVYIIPCSLGVAIVGYNILSMSSFINTVDLLQALQNDVEKLSGEIADYCIILNKSMLKLIYKDFQEARTGAVGSVGYSIAAGCVCAGSLIVGWPVYIIPCSLGVAIIGFNILSMSSFSNTVDLLQALQNDV